MPGCCDTAIPGIWSLFFFLSSFSDKHGGCPIAGGDDRMARVGKQVKSRAQSRLEVFEMVVLLKYDVDDDDGDVARIQMYRRTA